jgi:hypothetical protein
MPRVSVCLGSSRPGGTDLSLLGLARQTYQDFEVIYTDARYHKRHATVLDQVAASGLKQDFFHVPNHRFGTTAYGTTCAGYNTGFALAAGELVLILADYAYVPPDWIARHVAHHTAPRMVVAPHQYRQLPARMRYNGEAPPNVIETRYPGILESVIAQRELFPEDTTFAEPLTPDAVYALPLDGIEDTDGKHNLPSGPISHLYMHTKNESIPLAHLLAIGGMDENYDRGRGPGDHCLGRRLVASGLEGWLAADAGIIVANPRKVMPNPNIALGEEDVGERWGIATGNRYYEATAERTTANNPFALADLRAAIFGWRDLAEIREAILPKHVVSDEVYFRDCPVRFP